MLKLKTKFLIASTLALGFAVGNLALDVQDFQSTYAQETPETLSTVTNVAPSFTAGPSDGDSSDTTPTNSESDVDFTATASDSNTDDYYLLVCKDSNAPTTGAPPECNGGSGNRWALSGATASTSEATASYTTSESDAEQNNWWSYVCDADVCVGPEQGSGNSGTPFVVNHRPEFVDNFSVISASTTNVLVDGDMENAGVGDWTAYANATLTKETGSPHGGSQLLRIAYSDTNNPGANQFVLVSGKTYRMTGWAKGDGTGYPRIYTNAYIWDGTASTDWQYFDETFTAVINSVSIRGQLSSAGYVEFDDITVIEISPEPGDQLKFNFETTDSNGDDTTVVVCDTTFNDSTLTCDSEELCRTTIVGGGIGSCTETDSSPDLYIEAPHAAGSKAYTAHVYDEHNHTDDGTYEDQTFEVESFAPVIDTGPYEGYWSIQHTEEASTGVMDMHCIDANNCWAVGHYGGGSFALILRSTNGGLDWTDLSTGSGQLRGVNFVDSSTGWVVGNNGKIIKTINGGYAWVTQASNTSEILQDINCTDSNTCWAAGGNGVILKTSDGGTNWLAQTSGTTESIQGLHFIDSSNGFAVGTASGGNAVILNTVDGGTNWDAQASGIAEHLNDIFCYDLNTCWAVGNTNNVLKTTNGGSVWTGLSGFSDTHIYDVAFVDENIGWIVGYKIHFTNDGGATWTEETSTSPAPAYMSLSLVDADNMWISSSISPARIAKRRASYDAYPTNAGDDIEFKVIATDNGGYDYYLAVCKTDAVTAGTPPTCDGGAWGVSGVTTSGELAVASYTTSAGDAEQNDWYAFVCNQNACSEASQGSGNSGSPFVVNHQPELTQYSFSVTDTTVAEVETDILLDGDMEESDTSSWLADNNATLTKSTDSPHGGTYALRVEYNGTLNASAYQDILTLGKTYRLTGWARGNGTAVPRIYMGKTGIVWNGSNSTDWKYFDITAVADGRTEIFLHMNGIQWVEYDDLTLYEVGTTEPGEQLRFNFGFDDTNNDEITGVICDTDGFDDASKTCTTEELCRTGFTWSSQASGVSTALRMPAFIDENTGWVVGDSGTILSTTDGGANWISQTSGITSHLWSMAAIDANTAWAVGATNANPPFNGDAVILKTTDGGSNWNTQTSGTSNHLYDVHFADSKTGWAVGLFGTIINTSDGSTWESQTSGTSTILRKLYCVDADNCWVVGDGGTIRYTSDGGTTGWTAQTSGTSEVLTGVYFIDVNIGWAVGSNGIIIKTTDGGSNWTAQTSGVTDVLQHVQFIDANTGWAVALGGTILFTNDGGINWTAQTSGTTENLIGNYFINKNTGWTVGFNGTILKGVNGVNSIRGDNWTSVDLGIGNNAINSIFFIDKNKGWAVGDNAVITHTSDGGNTWSDQTGAEVDNNLEDVFFADENNGWIVNNDGDVFDTTDGGETWNGQELIADSAGLEGLYFINVNTGYAVGRTISPTSDGDIFRYDDGVWTEQDSSTINGLFGVYCIDVNTCWAVGNNGTIVHTSDGGATAWSVQTSGVATQLRDVYFADSQNGWAVGALGVILNTTDGGANWSAQYSGDADTTLNAVSFIDTNTGWIVGNKIGGDGYVLYTTDGGDNWIRMTSKINSHLYDIHIIDKSRIWASGYEYLIKGLGTHYCDEVDTDTDDSDANPVYIGIPEPHGDKSFTAHVFDQHSLPDDGTYESSSMIEVEDVEPEILSYDVSDTPSLVAGGYDTVDFAAVISDDNGDSDVTAVEGIFFNRYDEDANYDGVENDCEEDENDCYIDPSCTLNTAYGSEGDAQVRAACQIDMYFNAQDSDYWTAHVNPTDDNGKITTLADATSYVAVSAISGISVQNVSSIGYGVIPIGGSSDEKPIEFSNVGNQDIDILVEGSDMCVDSYAETCPSDLISTTQQKWHMGSETFDWGDDAGAEGPFELQKTAGTSGGGAGCINQDIRRKDEPLTETTTNESIYWKLNVPEGTSPGTYYGRITLSSTQQCALEVCGNSIDDNGNGLADCNDFRDCDHSPECTLIFMPMGHAPDQKDHNNTDFITNGDMEVGVPPYGWEIDVEATASSPPDERDGGTGSKSIHVTRGPNNTDVATQWFTTEIGRVYVVSGWMKNVDASSISIQKFDSDLSDVIGSENVSVPTWSYETFEFTATDDTTVISLNITGADGQSGRFDDVSVVKKTPLVDGDMEAVDVSAWTNGGATLTKEVEDPHGGARVLRIQGDSGVFASQSVLTVGKAYLIHGFAKSDGNSTPQVITNSGELFSGTQTAGVWQEFTKAFIADYTSFSLRKYGGVSDDYVEFDDVTVTELNSQTLDISTKRLHGILGDGATVSKAPSKKPGKGYVFDGVDDYIQISDAPKLKFGTGDFTIMTWIRTATDTTKKIFVKRDGAIGFEMNLLGGVLDFWIGDVNGSTWANKGAALGDGLWHHVAIAVDRDDVAIYYVDGQPVGTEDISAQSDNISNDSNLYIGTNQNVDDYFFDGAIADFKMHDNVLDAKRIRGLFLHELSMFK